MLRWDWMEPLKKLCALGFEDLEFADVGARRQCQRQ